TTTPGPAPLHPPTARLPNLPDLVPVIDEMEFPGVLPAAPARPTPVERRDTPDGSGLPFAGEDGSGRGGSVTDSSW
ncbi:hypothetical protein, partial [Nocardia carnea]|uniref:hypothetical protein n=1 Tax=Nocardia carnea TaxID=37328 RepID=UPI002455659A